ncbi:unnamed protein product, partial [Rotaria socialis]
CCTMYFNTYSYINQVIDKNLFEIYLCSTKKAIVCKFCILLFFCFIDIIYAFRNCFNFRMFKIYLQNLGRLCLQLICVIWYARCIL